jgi:hypothetical protein
MMHASNFWQQFLQKIVGPCCKQSHFKEDKSQPNKTHGDTIFRVDFYKERKAANSVMDSTTGLHVDKPVLNNFANQSED